MYRLKTALILNTAVMFFPSLLRASDQESLFPSVGRLMVALVLVLALIYVCIHIFRKFVLKGGGRASGNIRHRGSFSLSQKARLCVVDVGERTFLLGVTDNQVSNIAELEPSQLHEAGDDSDKHSFVKHLRIFGNKISDREIATG
jgi:flagellar biosynthetic protein FliO